MISDDTVSSNLQLLNVRWRNYLAEIFDIDKSVGLFQVVSGHFGLQFSDSSDLFVLADTVPTTNVFAYYTRSSNRRSIAYNNLLFSITPQDGKLLCDVLGDRYMEWVKFRKFYYTVRGNDWSVPQKKLFKVWSKFNLTKELAQQSNSIFKQALQSPLNKAINAFGDKANKQHLVNRSGKNYDLYRYSGTIKDAKNSLANSHCASRVNFNFDINLENSEQGFTDNETASLSTIFGVDNIDSMAQLNAKAASSKITIQGDIGKTAALQTQPGAWYDSSIELMAFRNSENNSIWNQRYSGNNWDSFFAHPQGLLSRYITTLLLMCDFELTVTVNSKFSEREFFQIKTQSIQGVWPFTGFENDSGYTKNLVHTTEGFISYTISSKKDYFAIMGLKYNLVL